MQESKNIYKTIQSKIQEISSEINLPQNINKEVANNIHNSSNQMKEILNRLESEINNLEDHSEWEHYTISFIGETNAGKSTIIEALRIKYEEEEKKKAYDKNQGLLIEEKKLREKLREEEKLFNVQKQTTAEKQTSQLSTYLQKAEDAKKSFLFKMRKLIQKNYEPYDTEISNLKKDIESNSRRKFEDIKQVIQDRIRIDQISLQIKYDGEIIGTGKLDYTQTSKIFFIKINNELVKIIDVPGIEGNEQKYEEEIKNAVSKSHCVFYVTSSTKTLESGTLSKVKKYIKDQADVFAIVNLRLNSYKEEYRSLSFDEIYKNKLEAISSISSQLQQELKDNFIDIVPVNGHWGFLSLSKYLEKEGEKQKLSSDKFKLLNIFQDESIIYSKSNFENLEEVVFETINQKESKIHKTNILKINTLIEKLREDLQQNLNMFLSTDFLNNIEEQAGISKKEVNSTHKDFLRDINSIRIRLLNDFKRKSYESIYDFVQSNDINENVYNVEIKRILENQRNLLQQNIESNLKESNEKINKQIEKSLSKFLDRLDTMSKMNNISFSNPNLNLNFDFFKSDLLKLGGVLLPVIVGIFTGVGIPLLIAGVVVSVIASIFKFFQSTSSKKSKILSKIDEQLNNQCKDIDKQLQEQFTIIAERIKKDLIENSLTIIDDLVEMYKLRRNKVLNTITELENIKIKD